MSDAQLEIEARWSRWLLERNLRGARIVLLLAGFFYPAFAVLDYLVAPASALPVLYASRVVVTLYTLAMLAAIRTPFAARRVTLLTALYILVVGGGIGVMIWALGGYRSPYYAGLNLVMLGAGVLFVWPARVAIVVHGSIVLMYLVMVALYESWTSPFIVLFSIPVALVGALLALALSGETMNLN